MNDFYWDLITLAIKSFEATFQRWSMTSKITESPVMPKMTKKQPKISNSADTRVPVINPYMKLTNTGVHANFFTLKIKITRQCPTGLC
jgi:hypothetical protein